MIPIPVNCPEFEPTKILLNMLCQGAKLSKVPEGISNMFNGLKYYSLELTLKDDRYLIQAYEQEAVELFNALIEIRNKLNKIREQS